MEQPAASSQQTKKKHRNCNLNLYIFPGANYSNPLESTNSFKLSLPLQPHVMASVNHIHPYKKVNYVTISKAFSTRGSFFIFLSPKCL
jgi:hypothetical protein